MDLHLKSNDWNLHLKLNGSTIHIQANSWSWYLQSNGNTLHLLSNPIYTIEWCYTCNQMVGLHWIVRPIISWYTLFWFNLIYLYCNIVLDSVGCAFQRSSSNQNKKVIISDRIFIINCITWNFNQVHFVKMKNKRLSAVSKSNKQKSQQKYPTVGTVPKSNKNTKLSKESHKTQQKQPQSE